MQENKTDELSKRDRLLSRLRSKYPDKSFEDIDDDNLYAQVYDDYDDYENELSTHREQARKFSDMFSADPRSASFLQEWRNGESPIVAMVRLFGEDIKEAIEDPERLEELSQANKEYLQRVQQNKELEEQYQANMRETLEQLELLQRERGLSDETIDQAMEILLSIVSEGIVGKFSPEHISMALKALQHDSNVEQARQEGEILGRNSKIEEQLRRPQEGDGIPQLGGTGSPAPISTRRRQSLFDIAKGAR